MIQAYELDQDQEVTYARDVAWIWEGAPVQQAVAAIAGYLAGPRVRGSWVEQGQLHPEA